MSESLYFHIPFCRRRCGYCDFVTFAGFEKLIPAYLNALKMQAGFFGHGQTINTVFFGGGTPTLILPEGYASLFNELKQIFSLQPDAEITLEANPGTVNKDSLFGYKEVGFNRISFGMQSARQEELRLLDRSHNHADVYSAVFNAREAGFDNINLDLIFGLPGQSVSDWKYSLEAALDLSPEHMSLYSLIVEEGTPLERNISRGILQEPDDDIAADQYEWACDLLERNGYVHYEISNWAKSRDLCCQHNMQYWRLRCYLGLGCGAVGFLPASINPENPVPRVMENEHYIGKYLKQVDNAYKNQQPDIFLREVSSEYEMETRMFTGFRLLEEGIDPQKFLKRYGVAIDAVFGDKLQKLQTQGLIEKSPSGAYRLTRAAWLTANRVLREFSSIAN